jgi:hypothetical protein
MGEKDMCSGERGSNLGHKGGGHLVHFKNNVWHNIGRIKFFQHRISKKIPNNIGSIKSKQSHYKQDR